ncbi:hypothetical protein B0H10DRAFT_2208444 [Mycena sp. CBHHK59/15]|nr:hypothetical protein B0H10DRAFT_2208444 [Mycena sp. CBHHK59/15]
MTFWLALILSTTLGTLLGARAQALTFVPNDPHVPQCTTLTLFWSETPPIHLHVQPGLSITETNLFDLGVQNNTFTTFTVTLPVGFNFSFAYNTLADQFNVFQSSLLTVADGTTNCFVSSSSASASSSTPSSTPSAPPSSSSAATTASASGAAAQASQSAAAAGSSKSSTPVGAIVGGVLAAAVLLLIVGVVFWTIRRRRSATQLDFEQAQAPHRPTMPSVSQYPPRVSSAASAPTSNNGFRSTSAGGSTSFDMADARMDGAPVSVSVSQGTSSMSSKARQLMLNSPTTPSTAIPSPRVHTDGGVRIFPEDLPPVYHDYNH